MMATLELVKKGNVAEVRAYYKVGSAGFDYFYIRKMKVREVIKMVEDDG